MTVLSPDGLEAALRDLGAKRYHRLHPFHRLLHGGGCTKGQVVGSPGTELEFAL